MAQDTGLNTDVPDKVTGGNLTAVEVNAIVDDVVANATDAESRLATLEAIDGTDLADDVTVKLGDSDEFTLQYTSGGVSEIRATAGTQLQIRADGSSGGTLLNAAGTSCLSWDSTDTVMSHAGSTRVTTTADGIDVSGDVAVGDNDQIQLGASSDFLLYHDTSGPTNIIYNNLTTDLDIRAEGINLKSSTGAEDLAVFNSNGGFELYYDNVKVFESTSSGGVTVPGTLTTTNLVVSGAQSFTDITVDSQLEMLISSGQSVVRDLTAGIINPMIIQSSALEVQDFGGNVMLDHNGTITNLYYDGVQKLATNTNGVAITGELSGTSVNVTGNIEGNTITQDGVAIGRNIADSISTTTTGVPTTADYIDVQLITSDSADSPPEVEVVLKEFNHASDMSGVFPEIGLLDTAGNLFQVGAGVGELDASIRTYCRRRYYPVATGTTTDAELNSIISTGDALANGHATTGIATSSALMISAKFRILQRTKPAATRAQVIFAELFYGDIAGNLERHDITMTFRSRTSGDTNVIGGIRIGHLSIPNTTTAISVKEPHGGV